MLPRRIEALARMAGAGYPVGLTIAPIMPVEGWREAYGALIDDVAAALAHTDADLTVELITHHFTATSKDVVTGWYPATKLEMDEEVRTLKRTRFGGRNYVHPRDVMAELRTFLETRIATALPAARVLYWT